MDHASTSWTLPVVNTGAAGGEDQGRSWLDSLFIQISNSLGLPPKPAQRSGLSDKTEKLLELRLHAIDDSIFAHISLPSFDAREEKRYCYCCAYEEKPKTAEPTPTGAEPTPTRAGPAPTGPDAA